MEWIRTFIFNFPGMIGESVRRWYVLRRFKSCGVKLKLYPDSKISYPQRLTVGNRVVCADYVQINAEGVVVLGNDVVLGPYVNIQSANLNRQVDGNFHGKLLQEGSVVIEDDVWIGIGVSISFGTWIGRGSVIGAGTVLAEKIVVAPYSVVVGNPGKVIANRLKS